MCSVPQFRPDTAPGDVFAALRQGGPNDTKTVPQGAVGVKPAAPWSGRLASPSVSDVPVVLLADESQLPPVVINLGRRIERIAGIFRWKRQWQHMSPMLTSHSLVKRFGVIGRIKPFDVCHTGVNVT